MRIKQKQEAQIISASDRMPEVSKILGDTVTFRLFFELDVQAAIESGVVICNFKVLKERKLETSKIKVSSLESKFTVSPGSKRKVTSIGKLNNTVTYGNIDVTKQISNDKILKITRGMPAKNRKLIKLVNTTDSDSSQIRSPESSLTNQIVKDDSLALSYKIDLIHRKGKDPAAELNLSSFHAPVSDSIRGLKTTSHLGRLTGKELQFRKSFMQDDKTPINVKLTNEDIKTIEVPFVFNLSKGKISEYSIEINAVRDQSIMVQSIKFNADLQRAFEDYIIPIIAPGLLVAKVGNKTIINTQQFDKKSTDIEIFRRFVSEKQQNNLSIFTKIANIKANFGEQVQFIDRALQPGKAIYRAISVNELSVASGEFSSAVISSNVSGNKKKEPDTLTLLAFESNQSVTVTVFNIPNDIVALRLIRKNLTTHEQHFSSPSTVIGGPLRSITRSVSDLTFQDFPKRPDTTYEYKFIMIDAYGSEHESQLSSIIRFAGDMSSQGNVLVVQQPNSSLDKTSKVTFQVNAPTDQASLDAIISILTDTGLSAQYLDEIKQNRELLNGITALEMFRFNVSTGLNESFGVVKVGTFEDSQSTRRAANVSPLVPGHKYIYQYRLLTRLTSTIFNNVSVERNDLETGRKISTNMKKFNSPKVLVKGTLSSTAKQLQTVSKTGLKHDASSSSESEMIEGRTSLTGQLTVQIPSRDTTLSEATVEETFRGNVIRWRVIQGIQNIDHIIIFAEYNGRRAPIRSLHYNGSSKMIFLDNKLQASSNEILYYVQPVFTDFKQGELIGPAEV
jgi:hypothetical protein